MTTDVENMNKISDSEGNVLAFYNDEFDVVNAEGEAFGYIDDSNIVCTNEDVAVAALNDKYVVEDEDQAVNLLAAAAGEEFDSLSITSTEVAEMEAGEVEEYEDEDYVTQNITIEEIDQYIQVLHDRGLPMEDVIEYPSNVVDLENPSDDVFDPNSDDGVTDEFRATQEYGFSLYRYMLDQVMDLLAPRDAHGERDYKFLTQDDNRVIFEFDSESLQALEEVVRLTKEKRENEPFDFDYVVNTFESLRSKIKDEDTGFLARVSGLKDNKFINDSVKFAKENPGKAAAGGAGAAILATISLPVTLAAGGAAYAGRRLWAKKKEKEMDPLLKEIQELKEDIKPLKAESAKAYSSLEQAHDAIDELRADNLEIKKAWLVTHRRFCVYMAAATEIESRLENEIVPAAQAKMESNPGSYSYQREYEELVESQKVLKNKLTDMSARMANGKVEVDASNVWASTLKQLKQKMSTHLSEKPILDMQLMRAENALNSSNMAELVMALDELRGKVFAINTDAATTNAQIASKAASTTTISFEALESASRKTGEARALIDGSSRGKTAAQRRQLLTSVSNAGKEGERAGRKKLLIADEKAGRTPQPTARKPRPNITNTANDAANARKGANENAPKQPSGARKRKGPTPK